MENKNKPKTRTPRKKTKEKGFYFRGFWKVFSLLFLFTAFVGFIGAGVIYFKFSKGLPDVRLLKDFQPSTITQVFSDQDDLIAEFYIEKRILVPGDQLPVMLKQATMSVEDSNFYNHHGIDFKAIFRAMVTNLKAGHVVEGGSTITQQLSKTLFLTAEKSLERKIREAILAVRLEMIFSKEEILEMYLNQIYYGHGSYGVEAASASYFGKHVQDLTLEECAMLAALPKAPNHYSPYRNMEKAKKRRNHAIRRMLSERFITKQQALEAINSDIKLGELSDMLNRAPYFVEYIRQFLEEKFGSSKLYRGGLKVYTTLNMNHQEFAQKAIRENLRVVDKRLGYRGPLDHMEIIGDAQAIQEHVKTINQFEEGEKPVLGEIIRGAVLQVEQEEVLVELGGEQGIIELENMAWARTPNVKVDGKWARIRSAREALSPGDIVLVNTLGIREDMKWELGLEQEPDVEAGLISLDTQTSQIRSMVGGYDFSKSQFNRAVQAVRQPGSAFKPIIYASAIKEDFTPASIIIDSPVIFKENEDNFDKWKPVNFEKKFFGPTSLRTALTHSRNVVTIKLLQNIGIRKAVEMARMLGITSPLEENLSMALGSSSLTLLELTSAYAIFGNMGKRVEPTAIRYIENREGNLLYEAQPEKYQAIPSGLAHVITSLMESVAQEGTGSKVKVLNRPVAGKTGTTNNYIDAWFMGFTPELVTGVWVGKDRDEPLGINETGSRTAIPIWLEYMQKSLEGQPVKNFPASDEVVFMKIDPETGKRANFDNPDARFEIFQKEKLPEDVAETESIEDGHSF